MYKASGYFLRQFVNRAYLWWTALQDIFVALSVPKICGTKRARDKFSFIHSCLALKGSPDYRRHFCPHLDAFRDCGERRTERYERDTLIRSSRSQPRILLFAHELAESNDREMICILNLNLQTLLTPLILYSRLRNYILSSHHEKSINYSCTLKLLRLFL